MQQRFKRGDPVIYRVTKIGTDPGPRAQHIHPSRFGETYSYQVDKYWIVADSTEEGKLLLRTRRGKEHLVDVDDPKLRSASWWERFLYRDRFPELPEPAAETNSST